MMMLNHSVHECRTVVCVWGGPFHFSAPRRRLVPCSAVGTRDLFRSPSFIRFVSGLKETACGCW